MADKNNQTAHPGAPPEAESIVNNQSSITNLEIPCSPDTLQSDPPIPACLLPSIFCPTRPSYPACLPSTLVETPLQIAPFCAKQSQFQNGQYKHKYSKDKDLCQQTTKNEQRTLFKTNPIKPNLVAAEPRAKPHFPPFFRISPSALGNTTVGMRVRTSRIDSGSGLTYSVRRPHTGGEKAKTPKEPA